MNFRCISRLLLVFHHKETMVENPPIPVLKRKNLENNYTTDFAAEEARNQVETFSFVLKRSGKVIRKVDGAPPINYRNWKPLSADNNTNDNNQIDDKTLKGRQLIAETLYIMKPLAHLGSVFCFGNNTWKPWMVSLIMDISRYLRVFVVCCVV